MLRYFDWFIFLYVVYVQSMCEPILRLIGTNLTNLENIKKIVFYLTHVTQKWHVMSRGGGGSNTSDMHFDQEHFETNQNSLRLPVQKLWLKQWFSYFW